MISLATIGMFVLAGAVGAEPPAPANGNGTVEVVCHGRFRKDGVAIGGETTGITVSFDGMTWDLNLSPALRQQVEKEEFRQVTVEGRLRHVKGVARDRWIVDVQKLTKREMKDPKEPKPKAEFTFKGKLAPAMGGAEPQSLEVTGEAWPVAWGSDPTLPAKGRELAGSAVIARGTAEANTDGGPKKYPIFHVQQLQAEQGK